MNSDSDKLDDSHEQVSEWTVQSFEAFFERRARPLIGLAYALCGNRAAAEDIVQEALLAAYADWDRITRLDDPYAWVRRIVANRSVSFVRRRAAEARAKVRLVGGTDPVLLPAMPADSEAVWNEVRRLPRRQAQSVVLRYYEGLQLAEIAEVLGCSKESVNTHLRRAHRSLGRRLERGTGT